MREDMLPLLRVPLCETLDEHAHQLFHFLLYCRVTVVALATRGRYCADLVHEVKGGLGRALRLVHIAARQRVHGLLVVQESLDGLGFEGREGGVGRDAVDVSCDLGGLLASIAPLLLGQGR